MAVATANKMSENNRSTYTYETSFPSYDELHKYASSRVEDDFRVIEYGPNTSVKEAVKSGLKSIYADRVVQYTRGTLKPTQVRKFSTAMNRYADFFEQRHLANIKNIQKDDEFSITMMPFVFKTPHPTEQEEKEFGDMFEDDGIIGKDFRERFPPISLIPCISYQKENKKSLVMLTVALIGPPKNLKQ